MVLGVWEGGGMCGGENFAVKCVWFATILFHVLLRANIGLGVVLVTV